MDKTWFDSPEERERAKRAKLDMYGTGSLRRIHSAFVYLCSLLCLLFAGSCWVTSAKKTRLGLKLYAV